MMRADKLLLLDVGGTFIKCSHGGEVPVDSNGSREEIVAAFRRCCASEWDGVAVAMPGPFDYKNGIFRMKHKYAAVYGENFRELAGIPDSVPIRYTHDVNGMLSGELAYGNGRGWSRVAIVTLGTGLGFSMAVDGEILTTELGSPLVSIYNRPYAGGVLEDVVSKRGFMAAYTSACEAARRLVGTSDELAAGASVGQVSDVGGQAAVASVGPISDVGGQEAFPASVKDIAELAARGDELALGVFGSIAHTLACEIAPILREYGIECLLFGGQISRSFKFMKEALLEGFGSVPSLKQLCEISDFDNATFNGLRSLFDEF